MIAGDRAIAVGDAAVTVAGGVESMSRAPWVLTKPDAAYPRGHETLHSTTLGWRLVNPRMPAEWTVPLGEGAEILADRHRISREGQDAFALRAHRRAATAWDEGVRPDTSLEALFRLRPSFRPDGSVTAGNASPLNDGAAAVLLADEVAVGRLGREPLARIGGRATSAVEPQL